MTDNSTMLFGFYKDQKLVDIPALYLLGVKDIFDRNQPLHTDEMELHDYIGDNEEILEREVQEMMKQLVEQQLKEVK